MADLIRPSAKTQLGLTDATTLEYIPDQLHFAWVRWCYASINKHFDDKKEQYNLYIEGDDRTQSAETEFAELRIDGPFVSGPQKKVYLLDVEINLLCQTHLDPRRHYRAQKMVGVFFRIFSRLIEVRKYGDGPLDDGSLIGCFHLRSSVDVGYYGIIKKDVKVLQTTIEGHYRLELDTIGD